MQYDFDFLVIGAGSGGVRASRIASSLGANVAVIENRYLGGTCVNVGCVPKKLFVYASQYSEFAEEAKGFGWEMNVNGFDWPKLRDSKTEEIGRLNGVYDRILSNAGVRLIEGTAKLLDSHRVQVGENIYSAEKILIATGGWPQSPSYPGAEFVKTSNEFFSLEKLPKKVIVEGGGYIAVEFAGILNGLNCETELVYRGPLFLRGFDDGVREFLAAELKKKGIALSFSTQIKSVSKLEDERLTVEFESGEVRTVDMVISAIGRRPMLDNLGLENTNVKLNARGFIEVNDVMQTTDDSIFAVGDVVGRMALTPVALREGETLARHLFSDKPFDIDYSKIPTAMFSQPSVATVGLTGAQAQEAYPGDVEVYRSEFRAMKHTLSGLQEKTLMKLIVRRSTDVVLGCHMVGEHAGEIIQGLAVAVNMGATKQDFDRTMGIHPTSAEEFVTMR